MSTEQNLFTPARHGDNVNQGVVQTEEKRAIAEVQAMAVLAKEYPRDKASAFNAIMQECSRYSFAESALYSYPRGGQKISGPSIRMAEAIARNWGNLDFGIKELSQSEGVSEMLAFCWDLETNTRSMQQFAIKHERHTREGVVKLTDTRDIYELTANNGARRLRARILAIIPGDVIEAAVSRVHKTLKEGPGNISREQRIANLITAFDAYGVKKVQLEKYFSTNAEAFTLDQIVEFQGIYKAIKDGMKSPNDYFYDGPGLEECIARIEKAKSLADLGKIDKAFPAVITSQEAYKDAYNQMRLRFQTEG